MWSGHGIRTAIRSNQERLVDARNYCEQENIIIALIFQKSNNDDDNGEDYINRWIKQFSN